MKGDFNIYDKKAIFPLLEPLNLLPVSASQLTFLKKHCHELHKLAHTYDNTTPPQSSTILTLASSRFFFQGRPAAPARHHLPAVQQRARDAAPAAHPSVLEAAPGSRIADQVPVAANVLKFPSFFYLRFVLLLLFFHSCLDAVVPRKCASAKSWGSFVCFSIIFNVSFSLVAVSSNGSANGLAFQSKYGT